MFNFWPPGRQWYHFIMILSCREINMVVWRPSMSKSVHYFRIYRHLFIAAKKNAKICQEEQQEQEQEILIIKKRMEVRLNLFYLSVQLRTILGPTRFGQLLATILLPPVKGGSVGPHDPQSLFYRQIYSGLFQNHLRTICSTFFY